MSEKVLILRYPALDFIIYASIGCLLAPYLFLPFFFLYPSEHNLKIHLSGFALAAIFIGGFFLLLINVPAIIVLNLFWRQFVFDELNKSVTITKRILFFQVGKEEKIKFQDVSLNVERVSTYSRLRGGSSSECYWWLVLYTPEKKYASGVSVRGEYTIATSIFQRRLEKKKVLIEQVLHKSLQ